MDGGRAMGRIDFIRIAKDTMEFTDKYIKFNDDHRVEKVEVFSPEKLQSIEDDEDEFFVQSFWGSKGAEMYVCNMDSYEAAYGLKNPLVMNFANAHRPGGGFLNGARAQEESLCRCSTLYKSISSEKASEMYDYNNANRDDLCDSDYMLLSPYVYVFRDRYCEKIDPFWTSVVTIAAPNKNGRAKNVPQATLDFVMKDRLRKMLFMAARRGYRELVLGAWGCGAFGHNTKDVAGYFYELFFEDGFNEFFDKVVFAILGDEDKIDTFRDVFGDKIMYGYPYEDTDDDCSYSLGYVEGSYDMPICNHTQNIEKYNIGYTQGITKGGVPFEAELFEADGTRTISVIMPSIYESNIVSEEPDDEEDNNLIGFQMQVEEVDYSILDIGMVDEGEEDDLEVVQKYVDFLVRNEIVSFASNMINGTVMYRVDINGNDLTKVLITMKDKNGDIAYTDLEFRPFNYLKKKNTDGKIISLVEKR